MEPEAMTHMVWEAAQRFKANPDRLKNATYYTLLEAAMELESWELVAEVVAMLLIENEIWKLDDI